MEDDKYLEGEIRKRVAQAKRELQAARHLLDLMSDRKRAAEMESEIINAAEVS